MEETSRLGYEILKNSTIQFLGTVSVLVLMCQFTLVSWLQGRLKIDHEHETDWGYLIILVLVIGVCWPFMMGKYDFETGRIGAWLASQGSQWEVSAIRNHRKWMLGFYDGGASAAIWLLYAHALYRTWSLGLKATALTFGVWFAIGMAMFLYAPLVHERVPRP
ncbi:MAG TPA: hypothetical protein VD998_03950 [Verrucomicrobiae bacterium]|nr:hypothetical protein [Verrucomicrobiae bacterium]